MIEAVLVALILVGIVSYFIPSMIAVARDHQNAAAIVALNILLGWTIIGWVIAVIWSLTTSTRHHSPHIQNTNVIHAPAEKR